jgi:polysaccharide transporter, PST family
MLPMNDSLRRVVGNFSWLLFEKATKLTVGLFVTILITRYLGVEKFGTFNYILAIAAIFTPLASLGLESVTIREIIKKAAAIPTILGSALLLRLVGGALVLMAVAVFSLFGIQQGKDLAGLICLAASGLIFQAFDVVDYYYQSQQMMQRSVLSRMGAFLITNGFKIVALVLHAPLEVFIWLFQLEFVLIFVFYALNYGRGIWAWKYDKHMAFTLLKYSWPIVVVSLAASIQSYFDQILLGTSIGPEELSQYTVALSLITALNFVPTIIYTSTAPEILLAKKKNTYLYHQKLKRIYRWMFLLSVGMILPFVLFSHPIVQLLYGKQYHQAGFYLAFFSLRLFFVNIGMAKQQFIVAENLFKFNMYSSIAGAVLNVLLNLILIPRFASMGAFIAILISYTFTVFLNDFFNKQMRFNLKLMFGSLFEK